MIKMSAIKLMILVLYRMISINLSVKGDALPTCQPGDYKYSFTECDEFGGRWRVSVPVNPDRCTGGAPNAPIRLNECYTSCEAGEYFNNTQLECMKCDPGTYSLGGGIRFSAFNDSASSPFTIYTDFSKRLSTSHSCSGWKMKGKTIEAQSPMSNDSSSFPSGSCISILGYTVRIVKRGTLKFTYQYLLPEDTSYAFLFTFNYRNFDSNGEEGIGGLNFDQPNNIRFPSVTDQEQKPWDTITVELKKPGLYIFIWKSLTIGNFGTFGRIRTEPGPSDGMRRKRSLSRSSGIIKIKSVEINGVEYASECTPCEPGTFSSKSGASGCEMCPENAMSQEGATTCNPCDREKEYSPQGSDKCFERPICNSNDYYTVPSKCTDGQRRIEYRWLEPKVCREDAAQPLPQPETVNCTGDDDDINDPDFRRPGQLCNPGMFPLPDRSKCEFCPAEEYNDGYMEHCARCPPSMAPKYELVYNLWNASTNGQLPQYLSATCLMADDTPRGMPDCDTKISSWHKSQASDDYIRTSPGAYTSSFLILSLDVSGFRTQRGGSITFTFETKCMDGDNCDFLFLETIKRHPRGNNSPRVIREWSGTVGPKNSFTYQITEHSPVTFSWIFKRDVHFQSHAKIYNITVTDPLVGGATTCLPCPEGSGDDCVRCPLGQYLENNSQEVERNQTDVNPLPRSNVLHKRGHRGSHMRSSRENNSNPGKCVLCPKNTITDPDVSMPIGKKSCIECGPGLKSNSNRTQCLNDCRFAIGKDSYDLNGLAKSLTLSGAHLFTASGLQYYHFFNISLCGSQNAICTNNFTDQNGIGSEETGNDVTETKICRSTIVPNGGQIYSAQPMSLGDELIAVTRNKTYKLITVHPEFQEVKSDIHFYYVDHLPTTNCAKGRQTTVTLRCAPQQEQPVTVSTPKDCPDGTCDGCTFHFLVKTQSAACRICDKADYEMVVGECKEGNQEIHYINPKGCIIVNKGGHKHRETRPCSVLPPQVKLGIAMITLVGVILLAMVFHFWKKNQKLEYKYSKLVEVSETENDAKCQDSSCAVGEDEEDEDETHRQSNARQAKRSNRREDEEPITGFRPKNRSYRRYDDTLDAKSGYETIQLNSKHDDQIA